MKHDNIGRFNERVILQQPISQPDNAGGFTITWSNFLIIWGFLKEHNSFEKILNDTLRMTQEKTLIIRQQDGLNEQMRCVIANKNYAIISINPTNDTPKGWLRLKLQLVEGV